MKRSLPCLYFWIDRGRESDAHTSPSLHEASRETREQGSDLGVWHLLRPSAEHRLHWVVTSLHEAKHRDTTTVSPTSALPLPFVRCYVNNGIINTNKVLPIEIHLTLLWALPTLAGLLLPSCLSIVPLWVICRIATQHQYTSTGNGTESVVLTLLCTDSSTNPDYGDTRLSRSTLSGDAPETKSNGLYWTTNMCMCVCMYGHHI